MVFDQSAFDVRCEWGERGVAMLAPISDVVIVVDVFSFSTAVDVAVARGAVVFPFRWRDDRAADFAASVGALLAEPMRSRTGLSLSPASLVAIDPGMRLVLPSRNGATACLGAGQTPVHAGCLRNASAVAAARTFGSRVGVVPAGERWADDDTIRFAYEDLIGAGAIIAGLGGARSPEATAAAAAFADARPALAERIGGCASGRELLTRGYPEDVRLGADLDASDCVPMLVDGGFARLK